MQLGISGVEQLQTPVSLSLFVDQTLFGGEGGQTHAEREIRTNKNKVGSSGFCQGLKM